MQFLYPNVLFFMLIPIIILMFLILTNKNKFEKYFTKETLSKLSIKNSYMTKTTRNTLLFIALFLMTIALARPVANEKNQKFEQEAVSMAIALDVSKSMLATDLPPNRLVFGKRKILEIIDYAKQNSIAIILFAKSSFILSPVTQDYNSLKILIENIDTGMNFDNGSNIFSTLEASNKLLKDYESKNLLILSDGGNQNDFSKEIEYANKNNINIYTLALASDDLTPIKLNDGNFLTDNKGSIVTVKLNENIKNLSLNTNAAFIKYSLSNSDIKQLIDEINANSKKKTLDSREFKTYTELFYYPLALSIFILLLAFSSFPTFLKRSNKISLFILAFILSSNNHLNASVFEFKDIEKANEFYKKQNYEKAQKEFEKVAKTPESYYNLANSYYKQKKYKQALENYQKVISSDSNLEYKKLHNMGNSFVKLNDLQNAKRVYEKALKIKDDKETKENLEEVLKALKQDNKNQNQNKENNKNNQNKQENQKDKNESKNKNKQENNKEKESKDKSKEEKEKQKNKEINKNFDNSKIQKNQLSDLEEQKWLRKLENNKKMPVMLKKFDSKEQSEDNNTLTPW
ncbi:hypothetical protein CP965_04725 [Halarcobacter mediterraneus]|uniref:VWFA domain-containing protein n=1 Tax=Halarcobacter mediterraneus TaxID=2023153 RepID=A0A4Q1AZB9_9BACT|nr:tetratricopeptide repeat protein [Halarcobacter mediterraneus]RXK13109.1 hypothetical protein CP965_04725 [Halarcobacter mediterraneus]